MDGTYLQRTPLDLAHDDVARLDDEITALEQKIWALKLEREQVQSFIALYPKYAVPQPISTSSSEASSHTITLRDGAYATLTKIPLNARIGNFMAEQMSKLDKSLPMATICEMLEPKGLMPGGKEPKQAVSAILGKDKRFKYTQGEGWSLVGQQAFTGPQIED